MTRSEFKTQIEGRPAFSGFSSDDLESFIDMGLEAVEAYIPKRLKLLGVPVVDGGRYEYPSSARDVVSAFVAGTDVGISLQREVVLDEGRFYVLGEIQRPSSDFFVEGNRLLSFGFGYTAFDLEYTAALLVDDLISRELVALRYYIESEGYQFQATKSENLMDVVDRSATGEVTSYRGSQRGERFFDLSERRYDQFLHEVTQPYFSVDTYPMIDVFYGLPTPDEIIVTPDVFDWTMERDFSVLRGGRVMSAVIGWKQGADPIENFSQEDIEIHFYDFNEPDDPILPDDPRFMIGDEGLNEIITIQGFADNNDGTGSITVVVDPRHITAQELMMEKRISIQLDTRR